MSPLLFLILSVIAVWRGGVLITEDNGPWNIFGRLRQDDNTDEPEKGSFRQLVNCIYCATLWLSLIPALILTQDLLFLVYWFAIGGLALILHKAMEAV